MAQVMKVACSGAALALKNAWADVVNLPALMKQFGDVAQKEDQVKNFESMREASGEHETWEMYGTVAAKVCELMMAKALARPLKPNEQRSDAIDPVKQKAVLIMGGPDKFSFPSYMTMWLAAVKPSKA